MYPKALKDKQILRIDIFFQCIFTNLMQSWGVGLRKQHLSHLTCCDTIWFPGGLKGVSANTAIGIFLYTTIF